MAETQTKPIEVDQVENNKPQTAETNISAKAVEDKSPEQELDEEIAVFEPVEKAVDRKLELNGETRTYVQHEMGFMTKLKFLRLLSNSIRQATEEEGSTDFLSDFFGAGEIENPDAMLNGLLRLVEAVPEFIEEAYCYALNVPTKDHSWAILAFENLSDEEGLDILDVLVAQNGVAIRDFFTQKLPKLGKRVQKIMEAGRQDQ